MIIADVANGKTKAAVFPTHPLARECALALLTGPRMPPRAGSPPRQLIVLLHGVGADGNDLIELGSALAPWLPGAAFVAPNGPEPCDMAPFGYQWFSLRDRRPAAMVLGVQAAAGQVDAFLDAELERWHLPDHQLALVGFSQGTMTALEVAPRRPRALAAVLGYSGALLGGERLPAETRSRPPVYLVHGDADEVVPVAATCAAVAELQAAGIPVQWSIRPGLPHVIDPESVAHGAAFLAAAFAARPT
jgi:phospholipase/carboxylesterase